MGKNKAETRTLPCIRYMCFDLTHAPVLDVFCPTCGMFPLGHMEIVDRRALADTCSATVLFVFSCTLMPFHPLTHRNKSTLNRVNITGFSFVA